MSTFTPTQWTLEPADRPDLLSGAVLNSLSRPASKIRAWGPLSTLVLGGFSFGILPLLFWPRRFANFVVAEQRQLWHLAEWLRVRSGDAEAQKVRDSIRDGGSPATLKLIPLAVVAVLAVYFVPWILKPSMGFHDFLLATYRYDRSGLKTLTSEWSEFPTAPFMLHRAWILCLSFAYVAHWLHVREHAAEMRGLVSRINGILVRNGSAAVRVARAPVGLGPLWILAAGIGTSLGGWWMIPACLAGAAHRRYTEIISPRTRWELAKRVETFLLADKPAKNLPTPHRLRRNCSHALCGKVIPTGAVFCPRCGTRVATEAVA
jgi:hypothetical protein